MRKILFLTFALLLISCKKEPDATDTAQPSATDAETEVLPEDVTAADVSEAATPVDATPTAQ